MFRGAIPGGAQGAQAPPKFGAKKPKMGLKRGLKPPKIQRRENCPKM